MENKIALIVGRFQPFHKGHLFLIKKALEMADKIIIGIGSANISDENNPFDFETRKKVIKAVFYKEGIEKKLIKIVPLDDFFNDKKWLENLKKQVGRFDLSLGNNDWTNNILKKAGYKVLEVDFYERTLFEGWRIRKLIKENKKWQDRVPKYIFSWLHGYIAENKETMKQLNNVVLGGTFDHFHKGHMALLTKAFEIGKKVTIGIATKEIYKDKFLSETIEPFKIRKKSVEKYMKKTDIIAFSDIYGTTLREKNIDAIVVSKETLKNALKINEERKKIHFKPLKIVVIKDVLADDGKLISSERIRKGEIDREGIKFEIRNPKSKIKELIMPESLRPTLQKPLGKIYKSTKQILVGANLNLSKKPVMLIAVGDVIVDSLLKSGIDPDVKIIDFKTRRKEFSFSNFQFSLNFQLEKLRKYKNNPGTINIETSEIIKEKIKKALLKQEKSWIIVKGEEDLLALPAILFAPLNSLVLYGHWQLGIIAVRVDEKIKDKVRKIFSKFI